MPEGQRRLAAVMFTDIVGFTALAQKDEALALRLLEEHRRIVRPLFVQYNGHEIKTIGDAFLVEFDSALDAARCAVDAQRLLHERNTQVAGEPIELRIGLHVGDVIHQENDAYGDAVNVASRIHGMAEPGGICLSEPVAAQIRGKIGLALERLPPTALKNVSQPLELYRLGLPWTEGGVSLTTPWVDREAELATAHRLLTRALRGEGSVLLIEGEAGIGKSRLAHETAEAAVRGGGQVLRGRCSPGELSAPYAPWAEAIRQFVRDAPRQLLYKVLGAYGPEVARLVPEVVEKVGPTPAAPAADGERALLQFLEGVGGFFSNLASEAPLLFLLDDLQWADSASITMLLFLARRLKSRPVLIVGAYREDAAAENPSLPDAISQLNRDRLATILTLGRFDVAQTSEMIARTFHSPETSHEFARLLHSRTGGNPFFVEEVLRALVRDGTIFWTNSGWERKPVTEIELPKALKEAIAGRLRRLDEATVELLRLASAIGYEFDFDLLRGVSGLEEGRLLDLLEKTLQAGLIGEEERPGRRLVYRFADHQIRDVVYADISLVRRRRLHLRVAQALEAGPSSAAQEPWDALAFHFLQGNDPEKALVYSLRAAEKARSLYANAEGLRHLRNALELLEESSDLPRKAAVLQSLGETEEAMGLARKAVDHYRQSAALFERLGQQKSRGEVLANAGSLVLEHIGDLPLARRILREAVDILEREGESRELAIGYVNLGYLLTASGENAEARPLLEKGLPLATKFGLANERTIALQFLANTAPPEEIAASLQQLRQAAEIAQQANALRASTKWSNLGTALARWVTDFAGAWEASERGLADAVRRELPYFVRYARMTQAAVLEMRGDWTLAREECEKLVHPSEEEPSVLVVMGGLRTLARLDYRQGHRSDSLRRREQGLTLAQGIGETGEVAQYEQIAAWDAIDRGHPEELLGRMEEARSKILAGGIVTSNVFDYVGVLGTLVDLHVAGRTTDRIGPLVEEIGALASRVHLPWADASLAEARAKQARAAGDVAQAVELFHSAAETWEKIGLPFENALALSHEAEGLVALGRGAEAAARARHAAEVFRRLEASPYFERLAALTAPVASLARETPR